jgi:hypothetical protein
MDMAVFNPVHVQGHAKFGHVPVHGQGRIQPCQLHFEICCFILFYNDEEPIFKFNMKEKQYIIIKYAFILV